MRLFFLIHFLWGITLLHFFGIEGAPQKAVFVVAQSVLFLHAAQRAFNAAGQLGNAAALARASF